MRGTTSLGTRWAAAAALAALCTVAGCGGDSEPAAAAPPTTTAAAPATAAAATGSTLPTGVGGPTCTALLQAAGTALTDVGEAGFDLVKAGAAYTKGAADVRTAAQAVGGEAGKAGEQVAVEMEAAGKKVAAATSDDPSAYLEAQKKVGEAVIVLTGKCGSGG